MSGLQGLVQILMSVFVEAGGQGVTRGGKGILLSGLRKIGWAKSEEGSGGRLKGHRLGGHRMGSGIGGSRANLSSYNPKDAHRNQLMADMNRGRRSGSDILRRKMGPQKPAHLFGRSVFQGADTLNGNPTNRWVRNRGGDRRSPTPRPRSFIKF